jgi:hypothetical protein
MTILGYLDAYVTNVSRFGKAGPNPIFDSSYAWEEAMPNDPLLLPEPDRHAVATRYHEGQIRIQFKFHKAWLLHARIMSALVITANSEAERSETRALHKPWIAPMTAGGRNRNKQNQGSDAARCIGKQRREGNNDNAPLTQRVRLDTDPAM